MPFSTRRHYSINIAEILFTALSPFAVNRGSQSAPAAQSGQTEVALPGHPR